MNTIEVPERNVKVEFPSCWGEMDEEQFACVVQNWLKLMDGKINPDEFMLIVLYNFMGIKRGPFHDWKDKRLSREQLEDKFANVWQLTELLTWLIRVEDTEDGPTGFLNYTEIRNRMPELENDGGVFILGPADAMIDITFGEYRRAWAHFEAYTLNRKHIDLDRLIATLYRPVRENYNELKHRPDFDGHKREPFNPYLTDHYAELLKKVPFWKKYIVYTWFGNCDKFIKEEELELDGRPLTFAPLFTRKKQTDEELETLDENDLGLTGLLYMIAESKLFGDSSQVDRTDYIDILTALLYWKQQADKIRKP
ncbi:MAG: hypothetical protein ACK5JD_06375 [Mangrovibacterium sp.]